MNVGGSGTGSNDPPELSTFGAAGAGAEQFQAAVAPPRNAHEMMGPSSAPSGGSSFLGRFSKGLDMRGVKEKTKAASATLSTRMNSLGSSLMSVAKKDKKSDDVVSFESPQRSGAVAAVPAPKRSGPPPGQLRCFTCAILMAFPEGVLQVKCPGCGTINNTPSSEAATGVSPASHIQTTGEIWSGMGGGSESGVVVACFACASQVMCAAGAGVVPCSVCDTPNHIVSCANESCAGKFSCSGTTPVACPLCQTLAAPRLASAGTTTGAGTAVMQVSCLGCGCRLQMPANAPAVSCPRCTMVTPASDPRANASSSPYAPSMQAPTNLQAPLPPGTSSASQNAGSEEQAIHEAIRRSLGQVAQQAQTQPAHESLPAPPRNNAMQLGGGVTDTEKAMAVSSVSDITGCDAEVAGYLLEANQWHVEAAVNQFLESGMGAEIKETAPSAATPQPPLFMPMSLEDLLDDTAAETAVDTTVEAAGTVVPTPVATTAPTPSAVPSTIRQDGGTASLIDLDQPVTASPVTPAHTHTHDGMSVEDLLGLSEESASAKEANAATQPTHQDKGISDLIDLDQPDTSTHTPHHNILSGADEDAEGSSTSITPDAVSAGVDSGDASRSETHASFIEIRGVTAAVEPTVPAAPVAPAHTHSHEGMSVEDLLGLPEESASTEDADAATQPAPATPAHTPTHDGMSVEDLLGLPQEGVSAEDAEATAFTNRTSLPLLALAVGAAPDNVATENAPSVQHVVALVALSQGDSTTELVHTGEDVEGAAACSAASLPSLAMADAAAMHEDKSLQSEESTKEDVEESDIVVGEPVVHVGDAGLGSSMQDDVCAATVAGATVDTPLAIAGIAVDATPQQMSGSQVDALAPPPSDIILWQGLEQFMEVLGLSKYTAVLQEQELTEVESLAHITDQDLKDMQVTIGARRKLLAAVRRLQVSGAA